MTQKITHAASTLSFQEKLEVTLLALDLAGKRVPVRVNICETRPTSALRLVELAAKISLQA